MGFSSKEDYQKAGIEYFLSPRGKHGDAHVKKNGDACRYDYDSHLFICVTKTGTIKTFWNLTQSKSAAEADNYWRDQKNE